MWQGRKAKDQFKIDAHKKRELNTPISFVFPSGRRYMLLHEGMKIFACDHDVNFQVDRVVKNTPIDFHTLKRLNI